MAVTLPAAALAPFARFSLYNSPYPAHERGCAIDLYPPGVRAPTDGTDARATDQVTETAFSPSGDSSLSPAGWAPSPVAGEVLETRSVRAPTRSYAAPQDYLILVDVGRYVARILHVEPAVAAGDRVEYGDPLGRFVRSGYFAPWVGPHVHLGFRPPETDPYRAGGSVPVTPDVAVEAVAWDGTGTVVATGETYALLDAPTHPAPGERFAALATDAGRPLDGGVVHYAHGGCLETAAAEYPSSPSRPRGDNACDSEPVSLLGAEVGTATGRDVAWADVELKIDGERVTGLSLSAGRETLGTKLVCPNHELTVGDRVTASIDTGDPIRLG